MLIAMVPPAYVYFIKSMEKSGTDILFSVNGIFVQSDTIASLILLGAIFYSQVSCNAQYQETIKGTDLVEDHAVHVILPNIQNIDSREDPNYSFLGSSRSQSARSHFEQTKLAIAQLSTRSIHKHFSDNFGPIHRIYFTRDVHEIYNDTIAHLSQVKKEMQSQLDTEFEYYNMRDRILVNQDEDDMDVETIH